MLASTSPYRRAGALDPGQLVVDPLARRFNGVPHRAQLGDAGVGTVFLQPQPLAQHLAHRGAHRVGLVVAGDRLDLGPGGAQPGLQGIGRVQHLAHRPLVPASEPA